MRLVEGRAAHGLRLGIGVLVMVLLAVAFTPAILGGRPKQGGFPFARAGVSSEAVVLAGGGNFTPPHFDSGYDANGNGLFDFLLVNTSVQISMPGNFTVLGTLHDPNYTLQVQNSTSAGLPIGPAILTIWFDGRLINQSGIDGPYTVDLILVNENFSLLDSGTHTTQPYSHLDFDPMPAFMTPPHPDSGQDTNGNGLFDFLNIDVQVQVNVPDNYSLSAFLHTANFTLAEFASGSAFLPIGPGSIRVPFAGGPINQSGIDGPYTVELQLSEAGSSVLLGMNTTTTQAYSHLAFDGAAPVIPIQSSAASTAPTIDGTIASGEWTDSTLVNLSAISGNALPAYLLVKNNATMLYMAYDAVGDTSMSSGDAAALAFDTGNDAVASNGHEDQFVQGGFGGNPSNQSHWVYNSSLGYWSVEDAPYNPGLPNHAGLASAWGFGPSPALGANHRMYEFAIPLALLGSGPNQTLGFFGGSQQSPGVANFPPFRYSLWPAFSLGPIPLASYGDLILAGGGGGGTPPPSLAIASPAAGTVFGSTTVAVAWSASDAASGLDHFELSVDGGLVTVLGPTEVNHTFAGLSQGSHVATVVAFDLAGHSTTATRSFTVDTTAPTIVLSAPAAGYVSTSNVLVIWTASDNVGLDHIEVSLDGGAATSLAAGTTSYPFSGLSDGSHTFHLRAVDRAGIPATSDVTVMVDVTKPSASITSPAASAYVTSHSVVVRWTAADPASGTDHYLLAIDGGAALTVDATATSYTFSGVADGPHTIRLTAVDRAGNTVLVSVSATVDTVDPTISIASPASGAVLSSSAPTVTWTADDATSGIDHIEVRVDGGTAQTLSSGATSDALSGLSDGTHTVNVTVVDKAGHSSSKSVSFRVDTSFVSPSGPYGIAGLTSIILLIVVVLVAALLIVRRRRRPRAPT